MHNLFIIMHSDCSNLPTSKQNQNNLPCLFCGQMELDGFRSMCIDTLNIGERQELVLRIKAILSDISTVDPIYMPPLRHYINNLLCSYLIFAIEISKEDELTISYSSKTNISLCKLHKIVYKISSLLAYGSQEEKEIFYTTLFKSYEAQVFEAMNTLQEALEASKSGPQNTQEQ